MLCTATLQVRSTSCNDVYCTVLYWTVPYYTALRAKRQIKWLSVCLFVRPSICSKCCGGVRNRCRADARTRGASARVRVRERKRTKGCTSWDPLQPTGPPPASSHIPLWSSRLPLPCQARQRTLPPRCAQWLCAAAVLQCSLLICSSVIVEYICV